MLFVTIAKSTRTCLYFNECDKQEVYTGRWKEHWHPYQDGYLCKNHYGKLIGYKKRTKEIRQKYNQKYVKRKFRFLNKFIMTKDNPRTGYCSICPNNIYDKSCKLTNLHHWFYLSICPWFSQQEVCASCHAKITNKFKKRKNDCGFVLS